VRARLSHEIETIAVAALAFFTFMLPVVTKAGNAEIASWYGGGEKLNKYTANGEIFDPKKLTCASWDHPFDTRLKVINAENGKSVIVRVNDRGPNKRLGRAIDLTKLAFSKIADTRKGLAFVRIEKVE